ncbi:MAG: thioredoxin fold domain-containing protein [Verrucomicrobiota bacterium]|nr:thioredoxin fold domain-containing protein [Verrucomicrobiota bacterium]
MKPLHSGTVSVAMAAFSLILAGSSFADEGWLVDFEKAKVQAVKEGKPILMEFTGSDWCPPCKALHKNVLVKDVFKKEMPKHFVLLKLDSPRDKSKQTPEEIEQYKKLSKEYKITGVPSILLADTAGKVFYRTSGYGGQTAKVWVDDMLAKTAIPKALEEANAAKGIKRAKLLDKALGLMGSDAAAARKGDINEIITLDANNKAGLKAKYEGILASTEIKDSLQAIMRGGRGAKPEELIAKIDGLIKEKNPKGEGLQELLFAKSSLYFRSDKKKEAEKLLREAKKLAPESKIGKRIDDILSRFFGTKDSS